MVTRLTIQDVHPAERGIPHKFFADASDLGFPAGFTPRLIPAARDFGNGEPFALYDTVRDLETKILAWKYRQSLGCLSLTVFND